MGVKRAQEKGEKGKGRSSNKKSVPPWRTGREWGQKKSD